MTWRTNVFIIAVVIVTLYATIDAISVDCTYEMFSVGVVGSTYTCNGRVLLDGHENMTAVSGNHLTGKGYQDVHGIRLHNQNMEFVPTNIESFFPNLIVINLQNDSITTVNHRHLIPFPNLEFLSFHTNKISSIDGDLFDGLNSLRYISFSLNDIRHVGHDLNLPINVQIWLQSNPCISEYAVTSDERARLKLNLLRNCPPTISQIEDSLERRPNLLTQMDGQIQGLIQNNEKINDELATQRNEMNDGLATLQNQMNAELARQLATLQNQMNDELAKQLAMLRNEINHELATLRNEQANIWHVMYDLNRRIENLETVNVVEIEANPADQSLIGTPGKFDN